MKREGEQLKGSWKNELGKPFLAVEDFCDGQEATLTIEKVSSEQAINPKNSQPKQLLTLHFKGTDRLLAMNVRNCRRLTNIAKSPRMEDWVGIQITLHLEPDMSFGKMQPCVRIKEDVKPAT